jgi:nucleotide-binding universal stress UspA family protein
MRTADYKILVPTDFSDQSNYALHQAMHLAEIVKGRIILVYVLHEKKGILGKLFNDDQDRMFSKMVSEKLQEQANSFPKHTHVPIEAVQLHSTSVHGKIVEYSEEIKASIIVMGRGTILKDGIEKSSIGSNTSRILRNSKIPIITIADGEHSMGCKSILLPLDLTKETRQKVSWGIQFAKLFNANIKVVSGLWDKESYVVQTLTAQMNQVVKFIAQQGIEVRGEIIEATEGEKALNPILQRYIKNNPSIDLAIIMTQQEDDFTDFFIGSSASAFIRETNIPVLSIIPRQLDNVIIGL